MITILFKTEFPFLEVRSEPLGQHLPKVKGSTQEGPLPFMPGRLKSNINIWRRTTNDSFVLSVIQNGYRIQWKDSIPPPLSEQKNSKNCLKHIDFITKSVEEALLLGVVQETSKEHIHNVLPLNVNVKKNNGKLRLTFNAMFINQFMVVPTFN